MSEVWSGSSQYWSGSLEPTREALAPSGEAQGELSQPSIPWMSHRDSLYAYKPITKGQTKRKKKSSRPCAPFPESGSDSLRERLLATALRAQARP